MADSIFEKLATGFMGRLHDLVDELIELDSPSAVRQHIRKLEDAIEELDESVASARGQETTARRNFTTLQASWNQLDGQVNVILGDGDPSNDNFALPLQAKLDGMSPQVKAAFQLMNELDVTADKLEEVRVKLKAKHVSMLTTLQRLEALDQATKAKTQSVDALKAISGLDMQGGQKSVDNLAEKIQANADKADAALQMAFADANTGLDTDTQLAQTAANLAARKMRLAQNASADSPEAAVAETGTRPAWMDA